MLTLIQAVNHEGETSSAWQKLKGMLRDLLTIPSRAAHAMNEEELRARAARQQEHGQTNHDCDFEQPETYVGHS
jgi:hypothetical protein